jgi:hypothetical protein
MGFGEWIKHKIRNLLIGLTVFDKKMLSQANSGSDSNIGVVYDKNAESLLHGLKNGVINKEVETLRWRMYKVLDESKNIKTKVISYDEDGFPITESVVFNPSVGLSKIKVDNFDDYKLELVVNNDEITLSTFLEGIEEVKQEDIVTSVDLDGNSTATIGTIKTEQADEVESNNKTERVITCVRDFRPKFQIENFAKKMNVRTISETEKLLEFYVSKYSDEDDRKSSLFLSEIKKAINNPRATDFLDILSVTFVSYNTTGVKDMLDFEYKITKFDKLVEFDGYYIVKFKAEVIKNGESLIEQYREEELDKKYENKERRKGR